MRANIPAVILVWLILSLGWVLAPLRCESADYFRRGLEAARAGELDRAIQYWTGSLKRRPDCYAAYVNRGSAYMMKGYVARGISDWHKAKKCAPIFAYGVYVVDFIDRARGDKRILNFAKPLELDPDRIPSVLMTAAIYLDLGRDKKAADLYGKSIELTRNPMLKNHLEYWVKSIRGSPGR